MSRRLALGITAAAALCLIDAGLLAGQRAASQTPTFRAAVDLVKVDVSVLDKQGQPVRGLTAKEFTLLEDGKPQQIQAFAPVDLPAPDLKAAPWTRDVAPDVATNTDADDLRLVVIVIDDAMLPQDPTIVANAKKIAKSVVEKVGAQDLAAVVFTRDAKHGQEFTHDHARLLEAVDSAHSSGFNPLGDTADAALVASSVGTLAGLAEALGGVTDRRKSVIWIGIGIPFTPWEMSSRSGWQHDIYLQWVAAMDAVRRANINVFAVDPGGLDGLRSLLGSRTSGVMTDPYSLRGASNAPRDDGSAAKASTYQRYLQGLADSTGGRSFVNANEFDTSVAQIMRETGSFYLLGYVSTSAAAGQRLRKIEVKVSRPGVSIRARSGYYPPGPGGAPAGAASPVVAALSGLLPKRDMPMRLSAAAFAATDDAGGAIVLAATVSPLAAPATGGIDVLFEALGADGKLAASQHVRAAPEGRGAETQFEAAARLDVPAGRYQVRGAAGNASIGVGSVYCDIDLPDFQKEPLSWSGAVMGRTGDRRSVLGPIVPITPLSVRAFTVADDVSMFARLYQGVGMTAADVTIRTRILDESGVARIDTSETMVAARFGANRAADVIRVLPLPRLAAGKYLLSLDATAGKATARRAVRFDVR